MAEEAKAGKANLAAQVTFESRVIAAWGLAFLSAGALFLSCSGESFLTGLELSCQGGSPLGAVFSEVFPVPEV